MTKLDLDAIETRAKAATPGPWSTSGLAVMAPTRWIASGGWDDNGGCLSQETLDFIVAARTDVPALIARVRELEHELSSPSSPLAQAVEHWRWRAEKAEARVAELERRLDVARRDGDHLD
jgi:hypothetical protein